ncbi:MAG: hypothetical protein ABIQ82_12145 [Variovorax sp.]
MPMLIRICAALAVATALAGCAGLGPEEPDKVIVDHGGPAGVSVERTGVLFGSLAFAPRNLAMSALSLHLRPVDGRGHRFEMFATNQLQHARWRTPDVDTDGQRIWVFAGRVPVGRYEIALAAVSGADLNDVHWMNFKPAIPVTVTQEGAVYIGRWQYSPADAPLSGKQMRVPGSGLVLADTPDEDQLLLARRRGGASPIGHLGIDDVLRNMIDQGRI